MAKKKKEPKAVQVRESSSEQSDYEMHPKFAKFKKTGAN